MASVPDVLEFADIMGYVDKFLHGITKNIQYYRVVFQNGAVVFD